MSAKPTHYHTLKAKWAKKHAELKEKVWSKHHKVLSDFAANLPGKTQVTAGTMSALMLLTAPQLSGALPAQAPHTQQVKQLKQLDPVAVLIVQLKGELPSQMRILLPHEEIEIGNILTTSFGMKAVAELDGKRLNRSYGLIGAEQHLARFPGDNVNLHATTEDERKMFLASGMAPGLGAWRYFANSQQELTSKDIEREKWYIAVPTFLSPGFNENVSEYKEWYKYRKMIVVNPNTGQAVVTDVADAGPAQWTGKHLGGSPEVMHELGLGSGPRKGAVLYYFLDDPTDQIPLGPIRIK